MRLVICLKVSRFTENRVVFQDLKKPVEGSCPGYLSGCPYKFSSRP